MGADGAEWVPMVMRQVAKLLNVEGYPVISSDPATQAITSRRHGPADRAVPDVGVTDVRLGWIRGGMTECRWMRHGHDHQPQVSVDGVSVRSVVESVSGVPEGRSHLPSRIFSCSEHRSRRWMTRFS